MAQAQTKKSKKPAKVNQNTKDGVSLQIYARVRKLMPWEPKKVSLAVVGKKVQNRSGKITNEYGFAKVFKPQSKNIQVFKTIVLPMISNILKGFNAVLIAYGQTGSGKTYSMLGKPKLSIIGVLPMMLQYLVDQPSVTRVDLMAVEAFGHHVAKIELFDLYDPDNQTPIWHDKSGNTSLDMSKARSVQVTSIKDAHDKIVYAHAASHFAPTGKNPESSRGHVTFVAKVTQQLSKHESKISYFVMVDCAGSEGESAFTPEYKAMVDKDTLMARRLEAGTINTGLSQLQVIFNQLRIKGELTKALGNGLRRVLHPYINTRTYLSVLFTLSPSVNNAKATESTLKFAVTAGMVKVKPVATKRNVNFQTLVAELRLHIQNQESVIDENNNTIEELERKTARLKEAIARAKRGLPPKQTKKEKLKRKKKKSQKTGTTNDNDENYDNFDDNDNENVQNALELLDSSSHDLAKEMGHDDEKSQYRRKKRRGKHGRTPTLLENVEAMKEAVTNYNKQTFTVSGKEKLKKPKNTKPEKRPSRLDAIEQKVKEQENNYKQLQEKQKKLSDNNNFTDEQIKEHAVDLKLFNIEQESISKGYNDAMNIVTDFLIDDGREAVYKFFVVRGILKKQERPSIS